MPLFSKNNILSVFRLYVFLHTLVMVELINKGTLNLMASSRTMPGKEMLFPKRWLYIINALYVFIASYRLLVVYSSRTTLVRMALYVWPIELVAKVVYLGYRASLLKPDTPTLLPPLLSGKVMLMDIGALLLVGPGLKLMHDETRASDERACQARGEVAEGLDKDQKESGRGSQTEENEEEPLTLVDVLRPSSPGILSLFRLSQNWRRFELGETYPSFVQNALIFHICVSVFSLFVDTRKSKRLYQAMLFALICGVLIDVALTAQGLSRFIAKNGSATSTAVWTDLAGLSQWTWIYPTIFTTVVELYPIFEMRSAIRDFNRSHDQDLKKAAVTVDVERQQTEAGLSQQAGVVHTP